MKQPMLAPASRMPPAQAEVIYDALDDTPADGQKRLAETSWPGEDWDDDALVASPVDTNNVVHGKRFGPRHRAYWA